METYQIINDNLSLISESYIDKLFLTNYKFVIKQKRFVINYGPFYISITLCTLEEENINKNDKQTQQSIKNWS